MRQRLKSLFPRLSIAVALALAVAIAVPQGSLRAEMRRDFPDYRQAFSALDDKQYQEAASAANRGYDAILSDVLRLDLMARPGNGYSFDELANFISDHRGWPRLSGVVMIAEQKIPANYSSQEVVEWFSEFPPTTMAGFYRYVNALTSSGNSAKAAEVVKNKWIKSKFSADEKAAFLARFRSTLSVADHRARLDRLLWDNEASAARDMYGLLGSGERALAEARLALAGNPQPVVQAEEEKPAKKDLAKGKRSGKEKPKKKKAVRRQESPEELARKVPANLQSDPGLIFALARWHRKAGRDDKAIALLLRSTQDSGKPEEWWDERNLLARRAMEKHDYALAYRLVANHGLDKGFDFLQSEFMAGWLSLRKLHKPERALKHFDAMLEQAATPVSRSRGHYWRARALEELRRNNEAQRSYESAAVLNLTFYGQLAIARLYENPTITANPDPPIPEGVRAQFASRGIVQAIDRLYRIGQVDRANSFFKAALDLSSQRVEFAMLMELAYQLGRADWAINAAKAANQKNMVLAAGAFPLLDINVPSPPDPAFTHAIIRQESLFNPDAGSPVGARGLMQLMPATARGVAAKLGVSYRPQDLTDPAYNLRLGTKFMQDQLDQFGGSYVLALAGYNAGPRRAREWIDLFGDPRKSGVDPVDWIELMPIYETRNYVQRILENLQVYRARLNGGQTALSIAQDLRR